MASRGHVKAQVQGISLQKAFRNDKPGWVGGRYNTRAENHLCGKHRCRGAEWWRDDGWPEASATRFRVLEPREARGEEGCFGSHRILCSLDMRVVSYLPGCLPLQPRIMNQDRFAADRYKEPPAGMSFGADDGHAGGARGKSH